MIERDVKREVKKIVLSEDPTAHIFMPVQAGFGSPDLDFVVSVKGFALRIETKVDGKRPTDRQQKTTIDLIRAGVPVLWIDQHNLDDVRYTTRLLADERQREAVTFSLESRKRYLDA